MQLKSSAPGSLMLLGEYGVLYGKSALVCAVNQRIHVTLTPRTDDVIFIRSSLGEYQTTLSDLGVEKPFQFVLAAIKHYQGIIHHGFELDITSDFSHQVGLGSSAAVTVATLTVIMKWLNIKLTSIDVIRLGRNIIREVQGVGSGADVAASVLGGMVAFHSQPLMAEKLPSLYPLTVLYSGFKTTTVDAIQQVQTRFADHASILKSICNAIGECAQEGIQFARQAMWGKLGVTMNAQQGLLASLGVSLPLLQDLVEGLRQGTDIKGAKISGSGLGDCVVGLGEMAALFPLKEGVAPITVTMDSQGVVCEKI
jgi:mevalonate kinase